MAAIGMLALAPARRGVRTRVKFLFGTDNTYYLDGRPVILIDPQ
jgi:hypothetical protein